LLRRIEKALSELREREEYLRTGPEAVQKAQAQAQAAMIQEPKTAGLWVRYYKKSHTELFRSLQQLRIVQAERCAAEEVEEESASEAAAEEAQDAPEASAAAPSEDNFPNDPKVQDSEPQEPVASSVCDTNIGEYSETVRNPYIEALAAGPFARLLKTSARGAPG
jgi:hypothetical protein